MDAWFICGLPLLNAFLVVLCWIPPVLSRRAKILLTLALLVSLACFWVDGNEMIRPLYALLGRPMRTTTRRGSTDLEYLPGALATLATFALALFTLVYVVVRVQRNRCMRESSDERRGGMSDAAGRGQSRRRSRSQERGDSRQPRHRHFLMMRSSMTTRGSRAGKSLL
jgi:hypothetical protein